MISSVSQSCPWCIILDDYTLQIPFLVWLFEILKIIAFYMVFSFRFKLLDSLSQSSPVVMYLPEAVTQNHSRVYAVRDYRRKNIIRLSNFMMQR